MALGEVQHAWVAGDAIAVTIHKVQPSKPCLKCYKGCLIECPGCAANRPLDGLFYLPVYLAPGGEPRIARFHYDQELALAALENHQPVTIIRPSVASEGWTISKRLKPEPYRAPDRVREMPQNIADALITLWSYHGRITAEDVLRGPLTLEETAEERRQIEAPAKADPKVLKTLLARGMIEAAGGEQPETLAAGAVDTVLAKVTASANGVHKKPPR